jgi:hypothetical protein
MGEHVVLHYERDLAVPLDRAYAWLTDYQDDDPSLTRKVVKRRPVVSRTKDVVVLDGEIEVLGRRAKGRAEVHLFPPDRWEARLYRRDGQRGSTFHYRLVPKAQGCRLVVDYHIQARKATTRWKLRLFKPLAMRDIRIMWDGFVGAMERDLAAERAQALKA